MYSGSCDIMVKAARTNGFGRVCQSDERVMTLGSGEMIGEVILVGGKQTYSVISRQCKCLRIKIADFRLKLGLLVP